MAMRLNISVSGSDDLLYDIGKIQSLKRLKKPMDQSIMLIKGHARRYPPKKPGSTYIRTNRLMDGWTERPARVVSGSVRGEIGNNVTYGPFVMDSRLQARIHRRRWRTIQGIVDDSIDDILDFFRKRLRE